MNSILTNTCFLCFVAGLFPAIVCGYDEDVDYAYLGVYTSRLEPGLSHQLGLPPGAHLQVERVSPGSPAHQAGVKVFDVLLEFDDQILINPDQLKALVRLRNPGDQVSLQLLRQGKKISVIAELTETPEEIRKSRSLHRGFGSPFESDSFFGPTDGLMDFFRRHQFDFPNLNEFYTRPFLQNPNLQNPSMIPNTDPSIGDDPLHGSGTDVQSYTYSSSTQQIIVSDEEGSLQWTQKDNQCFLRATDPQGRVLYEGPISTVEDRKNLPRDVKRRLQAMQDAGQIPIN